MVVRAPSAYSLGWPGPLGVARPVHRAISPTTSERSSASSIGWAKPTKTAVLAVVVVNARIVVVVPFTVRDTAVPPRFATVNVPVQVCDRSAGLGEGEARVRAAYGDRYDRLAGSRPVTTRTTSSGRTRTSSRRVPRRGRREIGHGRAVQLDPRRADL